MASLSEALDFTDDDLFANRRGRLTVHQKTVIRQASYAYLPRLILLIFIGCLLILLGFAPHILPGPRAAILVSIALAGWFLVRTIQRFVAYSDDQAAGTVQRVEGDGKALSARVRFETEYYVEIGELTFRVPQPVFDAVEPEYYRAYFAPYSMTLLSMEPIKRGD